MSRLFNMGIETDKLPLWVIDPALAQKNARQTCQDTSGIMVCGATLEIMEIDGEPISSWGCETCNDPDKIGQAAVAGSIKDSLSK